MFEDYVAEYKSMDLVNKRKKLVKEVKLMIVILEKICVDNDISFRDVKSKEILAINDDNCSESDYLEALFVYVEYLKEILGAYLYNEVN